MIIYSRIKLHLNVTINKINVIIFLIQSMSRVCVLVKHESFLIELLIETNQIENVSV